MTELLVEWNDRLSVCIEEIDDQHKKLVGIINQLYQAFKAGTASEQLNQIVEQMYDYTDYHFETEEKYFRKFGYEDSEEHTKEHKAFLKKALEFKRDQRNGKVTAPYEVMLFLKNWLINHIMGSDQKYAELFKMNGLK